MFVIAGRRCVMNHELLNREEMKKMMRGGKSG